jgi:hypothetical protein
LAAFLIIGVFHPLIIWAEYHFSQRVWPFFFVSGCLCLIISALAQSLMVSACLGILGFTCWWSVKELFDQEKRVERGWFPKNPRRK